MWLNANRDYSVQYLLDVTHHLIQILIPVGVIAGSVFAVLLFVALVCLLVIFLLKRPDIIRLVLPHLLPSCYLPEIYKSDSVSVSEPLCFFPTAEKSPSLVVPNRLIKSPSKYAFPFMVIPWSVPYNVVNKLKVLNNG